MVLSKRFLGVFFVLVAAAAFAGCGGSGSSGGGFVAAGSTAPPTTGSSTPATTTPAPPATNPTPKPSSTALVPGGLTITGGVPAFAPPKGTVGGARAKGVDVSKWQGTIDWSKVAGSGIDFAIARVSDGVNTLDGYFATNWSQIKARGMVRGVYQFFRPSQDPIQQADILLAKVGTFAPGDMPPFLDVETLDGVTASQATTAMRAWFDHVKAKTGITPAIYTSKRVWNELANPTGFSMNDLWVANWGVTSPAMPPIWKDWTFWQYSATGSVPGIAGNCDMNVFNGTVEDVRAYSALPASAGFFRGLALDSTGDGFWTVSLDGGVFAYGDATFRGTAGGQTHPAPFVGIVRTPTGFGYWVVRADGAVTGFGDAGALGNLSSAASPVVAMAATPSGKGYWLLQENGTVTGFGDATGLGHGAAGKKAVGIARTATGKGYWIASEDGSIDAFGDALPFGASPVGEPIVGIAATKSGLGCWTVAADGVVWARGDAAQLTYPSTVTLKGRVTGISATLSGQGYHLIAGDGSIYALGDAVDVGSRPR